MCGSFISRHFEQLKCNTCVVKKMPSTRSWSIWWLKVQILISAISQSKSSSPILSRAIRTTVINVNLKTWFFRVKVILTIASQLSYIRMQEATIFTYRERLKKSKLVWTILRIKLVQLPKKKDHLLRSRAGFPSSPSISSRSRGARSADTLIPTSRGHRSQVHLDNLLIGKAKFSATIWAGSAAIDLQWWYVILIRLSWWEDNQCPVNISDQ